MSYKPQRTFNGVPGEASADSGGPLYIENDLDELAKMFDPSATHGTDSSHPTPEQGGISRENLNFIIHDLTGEDVAELEAAYNHSQVSGSNPHSTPASAIGITSITGYTANNVDSALAEIGAAALNKLYPIKSLSDYNASKAWGVVIELGALSGNVTVTLPAMSSSKRDDLVITAYQPSGGSYTVTVAVDDSTTEGLVSDTESPTFTPEAGNILELSVSGIGEASSKRYAGIASKEWSI